jgi:hypothetical protein
VTPRASRLLRGTLLGSVATLLAALSHSWAGGVVPDPLALALGAVFASAVGTAVVGRRGSLARTAIAVAVGQLAFHLAFSLLGSGASVVVHAGHHPSVAAIVADPSGAVARGGAAMWLAHLAAGVLTVLYLRHLERRVWGLLARLGWRLVEVLGIRVPVRAPRTVAAAASPRIRPTAPLRGAIARRGPPLLASA